MTHPNSIMKDFGKAFSPPQKRKALTVEVIARKILAFDAGPHATFIAVGLHDPMTDSATGLTWQHIQALARAALPANEKVAKSRQNPARVKLTSI